MHLYLAVDTQTTPVITKRTSALTNFVTLKEPDYGGPNWQMYSTARLKVNSWWKYKRLELLG